MHSAGLKVSRSWLTTLGYHPHQGGAALRRIMSQTSPPTALVVANVNAAIGALKESRHLGLTVPEDLSMVSIHDAWTAENTWPPLTAVKMPMYQLGQAAVAALYNRLHNLPVQGHVVSDPAPVLMLRESTRPV
jgi:LacI family transcriptional regulator